MSETNDQGDKPAQGAGRGGKSGGFNVKRTVESGHVRQSFSHGRSKAVVVEKKRKRLIGPGGTSVFEEKSEREAPVVAQPPARTERPVAKTPLPQQQPAPRTSTGTLNSGEREARIKALSIARVREAEEKRQRAEDDASRRQIEDRQRREQDEARLRATPEDRAAAEASSTEPSAATPVAERRDTGRPLPPRRGPTTTVVPLEIATTIPPSGKPDRRAEEERRLPLVTKRSLSDLEESEEGSRKPGSILKKAKPERVPVKKVEDRRTGRARLTITNALDDQQRERSLSALKRRREREKAKAIGLAQPREMVQREVIIPEVITIQELSNRMAVRAVDIIKYLMKESEMHKITDVVDSDTAELIVQEFGHIPKRVSEADVEEGFIGTDDTQLDLMPRAPIVTIMGHVDHGKTSLLDSIRKTNVVSGEAGGITQHIGAYQVVTGTGQRITFIDTPGHEAFTAMRARGAKVTDIVVLVVAADDGVMPQTVEAINHAKSAKVPIIVAINKIDKPSADPNRVRTDLLHHEIVVESMSGDVLEVEVSALKGTNLEKLLETIALQAEVLELKANPGRSAEGVVIEAKLEAGRGPVGTVLIQRGTLHVGDIVVAGSTWGRARALINDHGDHVREAGPSVPVEVLGFSSAPEAGDQLAVVENEARARELTDYRVRKRRERGAVGTGAGRSLEQMMSQLKGEGRKDFTLLVKGDVQGSVEAITSALEKLGNDEVAARIIHAGVGGITESDVSLAAASGAVIVAFNVRANQQARSHAERDGIEIRYYSIIYDLVDEVKKAMSGLLAPTLKEVFLGNAEILEVFNISKVGKVAGCRVTEGKVERGARVRLIRDNVVIHEGKLSTLKRFKDEVREVPGGQECGMAFEGYQDMRPGDVIECFNVERIIRSL